MPRISRFDCASSSLRLRVLLRRARRGLWICLAAGVAVHGSLTGIAGTERSQEAAKPLTTQFIKRQPRLTKPLELKKRPQPKRRQPLREMVAVKAQMQREQGGGRFEAARVLGGLAGPGAAITRLSVPSSAEFEPTSVAEAIRGTKEAEQKIDMSLELLDIMSLDTGRYHAMVIQDPEDRQGIKGFCHLSYLFIPRLHQVFVPNTDGTTSWYHEYLGGPVRNLVEAMNRYTSIDTRIGRKIVIDDQEVFKMPWIYHLLFALGYSFSDAEMDILGRYLVGGGFIFADAAPSKQMSVASSHAANLLAVLRTQGICTAFEMLPSTHPIYHCYFDFAGPPDGGDGISHQVAAPGTYDHVGYLEGLYVGQRLVAVLSRKGYYYPWCLGDRYSDPTRTFQFGVNLIVFALTQEGSITRRLMDSVD